MKRILFLIGIVLSTLAFLAAGADLAAQAMNAELSMIPGSGEVWRTLWPDTFQALPAGGVWDILLRLPGWLILGAPGLTLIVVCRERGEGDMVEHEHSLYLFDELARQAHENGFDGQDDDMRPSDFDDWTPADERYAQDDVADDLMEEPESGGADSPPATEAAPAETRDYLLKRKTQTPAR